MEPKALHALCQTCPLAPRQFVPSAGATNPRLVLVGEAPGAEEVIAKRPFVGVSGQLLDATLQAVGVDPATTWRTNAVLCRPPGNADPSPEALACCRPRLLAELEQHPEAVVVTLGAVASAALGARGGILSLRGRWLTLDAPHPRDVMPTIHPAFVHRNPPSTRELLKDIEKATLPRPTPPNLDDWEPLVADTVPDKARYAKQLAIDTETDAQGNLLTINLAWGNSLDQACIVVAPFTSAAFNHPQALHIMHNGKFDLQVLYRHGIRARCDFDTMLANYVLDERKGGANEYGQFQRGVHGLKALSAYYFDAPHYDAIVDKYAKAKPRGAREAPSYDMARVPPELLYKYGALDAHYTWRLKQLLEAQLRQEGVYYWPFKKLLMRASDTFTKMELLGIRIDAQKAAALDEEWANELEDIHDDVYKIVPISNLRSTQQLATALYDTLKLPPPKAKRAMGVSVRAISARSTDKTVLRELMETNPHPIIPLIQKHRRLTKLVGSYVRPMLAAVSGDGRVHISNKLHGSEVGRIQSEDPSFHNLPRADEKEEGHYGMAIRDLVIPADGMVLLIADLSQAELRVGAAMSQDPVLIEAFTKGGDPHSNVALRVFGPGAAEEERHTAKAINFGVLFGGKRNTLITRVLELRAVRPTMKIRPDQVAQVIDDYMSTMRVFFEWRESQFQHVREHGFVESRTGRRRRFLLINRTNEDEVRKACVHAPVSGLASDINTLACCKLTEQGIRTLLTVHDSILFEAPTDQAQRYAQLAASTILETWNEWIPEVPGDVDVKIGEPSWGRMSKLAL